nr:hypothetical protein [Mycolicibacterium doricum]
MQNVEVSATTGTLIVNADGSREGIRAVGRLRGWGWRWRSAANHTVNARQPIGEVTQGKHDKPR